LRLRVGHAAGTCSGDVSDIVIVPTVTERCMHRKQSMQRLSAAILR